MPDLQAIRDLRRQFVSANVRVNEVIADESNASSSTGLLIIADENDLAQLKPNADQDVSRIPNTGKTLSIYIFCVHMLIHLKLTIFSADVRGLPSRAKTR